MAIETQKFVRKPLYVDAVRVTPSNFDEIKNWCQGEVAHEFPGESGFSGPNGKKYIRVRVHNPKNPRQTKAFIGDWILYTERGYKVYTNKAFHASFDKIDTDSSGPPTMVGPRYQIPKFYFDLDSGELTENKPGPHAKPLELPELINIIRNEIVGGEIEPPAPVPIPPGLEETIKGVVAEMLVNSSQDTDEFDRVEDEIEELDVEVSELTEEESTPPVEVLNAPVQLTAADIDPETKHVLSLKEQSLLTSEEIKEMVQSGEVILEQDIKP